MSDLSTVLYFDAEYLRQKMWSVEICTVNETMQSMGQFPNAWKQPEWQICPINLTPALAHFPQFQLVPGWSLVTYRFSRGRIRMGQVWAVPAGAPVLSPAEFGYPESQMYPKPHPPQAQPVMTVLQGDGSPEAYMLAPFLSSFLHGLFSPEASWTRIRSVVDGIAERSGRGDTSLASIDFEVRWLQPSPEDWRPRVIFAGDQVTVRFYSVDRPSIFECQYRYVRGNYSPSEVEIAELAG